MAIGNWLLVSNKLIFIGQLFPPSTPAFLQTNNFDSSAIALQKELRSGRAVRFADSKFKRIRYFSCEN